MQIKKRKRKDLENESTPPIPFHHLNQINVGLCLSFFYLMEPLEMEETLQIPAVVVKGMSLKHATRSPLVHKSTCSVSHTFFFGFNTSSASPSIPPNFTLSPTFASFGGSTNSTYNNNK